MKPAFSKDLCQYQMSLLQMADKNLNVNISSCRTTRNFTVADIENGGQHIFVQQKPTNGKMEYDNFVVTRDRSGNIVSCGMGGNGMEPFELLAVSECTALLPRGVPAPQPSSGLDMTLKTTINLEKSESCNGFFNYKEVADIIKSRDFPEASNKCIRVRKNTYDIISKNSQILYRYYSLRKHVGALKVMTPNKKSLVCGNFNDDINEFFEWDITECIELEKEDLIYHKRLP
jgi:hypothetical protein